jgi:hypothetical protein
VEVAVRQGGATCARRSLWDPGEESVHAWLAFRNPGRFARSMPFVPDRAGGLKRGAGARRRLDPHMPRAARGRR